MTSSYPLVKSLLSDLLQVVTAEVVSNSSLELSFSSTPDHPLPCSADFQFFFSISTTAPPHSPDGVSSSTYSDVTPPPSPSPPTSLCPTPTSQAKVSTPPSPGVSLLPLSGQMTQAVLQAPNTSTFLMQDNDSVKVTSIQCSEQEEEEEPVSKRIKRELVEDFDLLWEEDAEVDIELDDDEDDIVDYNKASSDTEDDLLPFPLTFNTSADLRWKLQKADILPAVSVLPSQRPASATGSGLVRIRPGKVRGRTEGMGGTEGETSVKEERREEDHPEDKDDSSADDVCAVEEVDYVDEDCDYLASHGEKEMLKKDGQMSRSSLTMINLLNRPPRLGLSKLYRKFNNLHEVSIIEKEE